MLAYTPTEQQIDIPIYGISDLVKGDAGTTTGAANEPIKKIADNIARIYSLLNRYNGDLLKTDSYTFNIATDLRKHLIFEITDNKNFTLPNVTTLKAGEVISVKCLTAGVKTLSIAAGTQAIILGKADSRNTIYLHDGEAVYIMAATDGSTSTPNHWELIGNYDFLLNVGMSIGGRALFKGHVINNGSVLNRQDYARLFEWVSNSLAFGQSYVSYAVWSSDMRYQGCFNDGDGVTTFGLPDERAMHDRYLDLGRGIDTGRLHDYPGGYGPDGVKEHDHAIVMVRSTSTVAQGTGNTVALTGLPENQQLRTKLTGGTENTVKTIGKIPMTKY